MQTERWQKLKSAEQLKHIASEIKRASFYETNDKTLSRLMLERALILVDLTLNSQKQLENSRQLFILRNLIAESYLEQNFKPSRIYAFL